MSYTISNGVVVEYDGREPTPAEAEAVLAALQRDEAAAALHRSAAQAKAAYTYNGVNFDLNAKDEHYKARAEEIATGIADAAFPFSLVGEDGLIAVSNKEQVAVIWQDMRAHILAVEIQLSKQLEALNA